MDYDFHVAASDDPEALAVAKAHELLPKGEAGQKEAVRIVDEIVSYLTKTQSGRGAPKPEVVPDGLDATDLVRFTNVLKRHIPSAFPGERRKSPRHSSDFNQIADRISRDQIKRSQRK